MKDRTQKADALRYAIARRWFPQLELDVSTLITIDKAPTNITDVDVFASIPDDFGGFRSVVIDCKTRKGESPISKAMWQKGLMARLEANLGLCILRIPKIQVEHRYTAAQLGVTLLTESEFAAFAKATAVDYESPLGAVADLDLWDAFFAISTRYRQLEPAVKFSRSGFWMSENAAEACIRTIFLVLSLRRELDPDKPEHLAIVADLAALLSHSLARIVISIFSSFLQPGQQAELSRALLYFLYGGKSAYDHLNRIKQMIAASRQPNQVTPAFLGAVLPSSDQEAPAVDPAPTEGRSTILRQEPEVAFVSHGQRDREQQSESRTKNLQLPEWERFVELVRQMLDAPLEVSRSPLLLREVAWSALAGGAGKSDGVTAFARTLATSSPQGARFSVLTLDYLCRAGRLPREFNDIITSWLLAAQMRP